MDSNVRDEFYEPVEAVNRTAIGAHVQTYHPITSNITQTGAISGQVVFELNTGAGEYLDLFKTHLQLRYTIAGAPAVASVGDCPLSNMIARGQLYVNGKKIAASQNWTQDAVLSKRIAFSKAYNMSVNNLTYNRIAQPAPVVGGVDFGHAVVTLNHDAPFTAWPTATAEGTYIDDEYLDALFIRDESCIIPPNCNVRLLLDIDSNYLMKMALLNAANPPVGALTVQTIRMIAYTIVKSGPPPKEYVMNLITLNSFLSTLTGLNENRQYQVSPTIVKAAVTFLSQDYLAPAVDAAHPKIYAGNILSYAADTVGNRLTALDFKLNNITIPNTRWDFNTNGFREAYLNYINESGGISDSAGKESFAEWQRYGMIHLANIVKAESDKSNSLQVNLQFEAMTINIAFLIVTSFEEQTVRMIYDTASGALVDTMTLL